MAGLHRFCRVAAGGAHSLLVTERAEVLAWGSNSHGQVGNDSVEEPTQPRKRTVFLYKWNIAIEYYRHMPGHAKDQGALKAVHRQKVISTLFEGNASDFPEPRIQSHASLSHQACLCEIYHYT